ncbi:MAG: hypothetical protein Q8L24_02690 [bacterium]|nr:hypothetical protein [bacterium]
MNASPSDAVKPVVWKPTSEEMMKALLMVLTDKSTTTDCLFWHGSPTNSRLQNWMASVAIADFCGASGTKNIIVNGLTATECRAKNLCYKGREYFLEALSARNIAREQVIIAPGTYHTAAESEALLVMMKEHGWKSVTIVSQPHHQLRCFLQIIASMKKLGIYVKAYNWTSWVVDWSESLEKPLLGGGSMDGTLVDQVQGEHDRIVHYADPTDTGYSLNATIPEMFEYLKTREQM